MRACALRLWLIGRPVPPAVATATGTQEPRADVSYTEHLTVYRQVR